MITPNEGNGFLAVVYDMMERMTTQDRVWFIKAVKLAKKQMDVMYPNGRSEPEAPKVDIIKPVEGLIVPDGTIK